MSVEERRILVRRDEAAAWDTEDPILSIGEPAFDKTEKVFKVGDGTTPWSQLPPAEGDVFVRQTTEPATKHKLWIDPSDQPLGFSTSVVHLELPHGSAGDVLALDGIGGIDTIPGGDLLFSPPSGSAGDLVVLDGSGGTNALDPAPLLTENDERLPGERYSIEKEANYYQLVGDQETPGPSRIYGTNSSGTRGWYAQTSAVEVQRSIRISPSNQKLELVGDLNSPGVSKRYGTDSEGVRGWQDADDAPPGVKGSLEVDDGDLQLDGDSTSPAAGLAYSTDHEGNRGWHQPPNGWVLVQEEVGDPIPDRPAVAGPGQVIWSLLSAPTGQPDALDIVINRSGDPWE